MRIFSFVLLLTAVLAAPAAAQNPSGDVRPALPSFYGDTGLWFVPTAETLPARHVATSVYRSNVERPQGLTDVANIALTGALGVTNRLELFGSWGVVRMRRGVRSPFFTPTDTAYGGVDQDHPYLATPWSKTLGAPLYLGAKVNLLSQSRNDVAGLGVRGMFKIPVGGAIWGDTDAVGGRVDLVVSRELARRVEITGTVGGVFRRSPREFRLSNGAGWGVGAQFPTRSRLRALVEFEGEHPIRNSIDLRNGALIMASDGSVAPGSSDTHSPADLKMGAVWQTSKGLFVHGGANYSRGTGDRIVASQSITHSGWGFDIRLGFHPGTALYVPPPPPALPSPVASVVAPPAQPVAPVVPPAPPANRNPTMTASCDPCTVEAGKTSQLRATAADPDNEPLTYQWAAPAGSFSSAATASPVWTAPVETGTVSITATATDPRGGVAFMTLALQVVRPPVKTYTFDDVHFDFDRYSLKPESVQTLDDAVRALNEDTGLRVVIEGHCDGIGTAEYNLALGDRRATAARNYLVSRGIAASRLETTSYGEERPKADNATAQGRAINRRAALVVKLQ